MTEQERENQIKTLRKVMTEMPMHETATARAKWIALEVRRLEKSYPQRIPQITNSVDC